MERLRQNYHFRKTRTEKLKRMEAAMKAEKQQWEREREKMEAWLCEKRAETAREAQELEEALAGVGELWGRVAGTLRGEARRAGRRMEGRWTRLEGALEREREGLREEARGERKRKEREREQADRAMECMEERRALETKVWEKERESLEEMIRWKSEQVDAQRRRARDALQEKERAVSNIWEEFAALASSDWADGGTGAEAERMEEDRLRLEIWGEVELMDRERQQAEKSMFCEMGRMEGEIRKLRKQREAARRQMELAAQQMEVARRRLEEATVERGHMEQELRETRELMEEEREGGAARRWRRSAWYWPLVCCLPQD